MHYAEFRFQGTLNDHLRPNRRGTALVYRFDGRPAVRDAIEALGVPHPEVDAIVVDGTAVDFAYRLREGDHVTVWPLGAPSDPVPVVRVGPPPLSEPRFVLDIHLGRLAAYLRMLGFDTRYGSDAGDEALANSAAVERRALLTRDRGLLKRSIVMHGYYVRAVRPRAQLREVVDRFGLAPLAAPFTRCMRCNGSIEPVDVAQVRASLQPLTLHHYDAFRRCASCGAVYWAGPHHRRMRRLVAEVLGEPG